MRFRLHRPPEGLPFAVVGPTSPNVAWWPAILFLHGRGERGDDGLRQTTVGLGPALEEHRRRWPAVVVMPQCPEGEVWTGEILDQALAALDHALEEYPINKVRVSLAGISMGAGGAMELAARYPWRFTRLLTVCGVARPDAAEVLRRMPVWIHHGARDEVIPVAESQAMVSLLAEGHPHLRYDEYPDAAHDVWDRVFASAEVARWLSDEYKLDRVELPPVRPVFVGGTGRSGTSTMASLLARHGTMVATPEVRLHGRKNGIIDVLEGKATPRQFAELARGSWFYRWNPGEAPVGVHRMVDEARWDAVLDRYLALYPDDPDEASRLVLRAILDPVARDRGAKSWVEHSPLNGRNAATLYRLFPDMRLVHCVRDGRDVARSMVRQPWGPESTEDALVEWADRLRIIHESTSRVPAGQLLVVRWEEFVETDRDAQYARVLDFLGLSDQHNMRRYFDAAVNGSAGNLGRWRREMSAQDADRLDKLYRELLIELREDGVTCLPVPPE